MGELRPIEAGSRPLGLFIGGFGVIMAIGFGILDIRNTTLVTKGKTVLRDIEPQIGIALITRDHLRSFYLVSLVASAVLIWLSLKFPWSLA